MGGPEGLLYAFLKEFAFQSEGMWKDSEKQNDRVWFLFFMNHLRVKDRYEGPVKEPIVII